MKEGKGHFPQEYILERLKKALGESSPKRGLILYRFFWPTNIIQAIAERNVSLGHVHAVLNKHAVQQGSVLEFSKTRSLKLCTFRTFN